MNLSLKFIATCVSSAVLLILSVKGIRKHFRLKRKMLFFLQKNKISPTELQEYFSKNLIQGEELIQKNEFEKILPKAFVQGKSIPYEYQKEMKYLYFQKKTTHNYWQSKPVLKSISTTTLPFKIIDLNSHDNMNECFVSIHQNDKVKCLLPLRKLNQKTQEDKRNFIENLGLKCSQFIFLMIRILKLPVQKNVFVSVSNEEFGINFEKNICVYGDLVYNFKERTMRIDHPLKFLASPSQMIMNIKDKIWRNKIITGIFVIGTGVSFCMLYAEYFKSSKSNLKAKQVESSKALSQVKHVTTKGKDFRCETCRKRQKNMIFQPCSHLAVCKECFENNKEKYKSCSICNIKLTGAIEILIP